MSDVSGNVSKVQAAFGVHHGHDRAASGVRTETSRVEPGEAGYSFDGLVTAWRLTRPPVNVVNIGETT